MNSQRGAAVPGRRAPLLLVVAALWATVVPYLARALDLRVEVPASVEIVDHVVPGVLALAAAAVWLALLRRRAGRPNELASLVAPALAFLAGFWITATHVPLVIDAAQGAVPWGPALLHGSAGPPLAVLGLLVVLLPADRP